MRLRFLDLEPEEVFANARAGDARCSEFVTLCHRALAAATATSIHMDGPGQFYITGHNAHFIDIPLLDRLVHAMVEISPLRGSHFAIVPPSDPGPTIITPLTTDPPPPPEPSPPVSY